MNFISTKTGTIEFQDEKGNICYTMRKKWLHQKPYLTNNQKHFLFDPERFSVKPRHPGVRQGEDSWDVCSRNAEIKNNMKIVQTFKDTFQHLHLPSQILSTQRSENTNLNAELAALSSFDLNRK